MDDQILTHLMDIKERLASIETRSEEQTQMLRDHRVDSLAAHRTVWAALEDTQQELEEVKTEVIETRGKLKGIKWLAGLAAAVIAALVKLMPLPWK